VFGGKSKVYVYKNVSMCECVRACKGICISLCMSEHDHTWAHLIIELVQLIQDGLHPLHIVPRIL
jgi:hypothetical protein